MIILALGSNKAGRWGNAAEVVSQAIAELDAVNTDHVVLRSSLYRTAGMGPGQPDDFINAVVTYRTHLAPQALLRRIKQIERMAGGRSALRWGPRTLDIDIIDYHGRLCRWGMSNASSHAHASPGKLVLPHPLMHKRPFVLEPLREILPQWRHPVFFRTAEQLAYDCRNDMAGRILKKLN